MAPEAQIPTKRNYRISEVCAYTDTQPYILRFWESEFPQLRPEKSRGGSPVYSRKDLDLVLRIRQLLYDEEYTLVGARRRLDQELKGQAPKTSRSARKRQARSGPTRAHKTAEPVPTAVPLAAEAAQAAAPPAGLDFGDVPRLRYEDALEEISHLRLQLKDAEVGVRKAEARAADAAARARVAGQAEEQCRSRAEQAAATLQRLLDSL